MDQSAWRRAFSLRLIEPNEISEEIPLEQTKNLPPSCCWCHFAVFQVGNGSATLDEEDRVEHARLKEELAKVDSFIEPVMRDKLPALKHGFELIQEVLPAHDPFLGDPQAREHRCLFRPRDPFIAIVGFPENELPVLPAQSDHCFQMLKSQTHALRLYGWPAHKMDESCKIGQHAPIESVGTDGLTMPLQQSGKLRIRIRKYIME